MLVKEHSSYEGYHSSSGSHRFTSQFQMIFTLVYKMEGAYCSGQVRSEQPSHYSQFRLSHLLMKS